jgi:hypothetical protein
MRNSNWFERFLDCCAVVGKKLGKVAVAFSWIEKVYKNEMVREIYKTVTSWLI